MFAEQPSVKLCCQLCCSVFKDPVITTCGVSCPPQKHLPISAADTRLSLSCLWRGGVILAALSHASRSSRRFLSKQVLQSSVYLNSSASVARAALPGRWGLLKPHPERGCRCWLFPPVTLPLSLCVAAHVLPPMRPDLR